MGAMSPEKQADLLKDKGNQYFKKEKLGAAIEAYTEAITLCPGVPLYWTNRAICERKREEWEKVEADCRRALELDTNCVKAYYLLGLALVHYQQFEEGVKQLEKAMHLGRGAEGNYLVPEIWQELAKAKFAEWEALSAIRNRHLQDLKSHLCQLLREDYNRKLSEATASIKAATTAGPNPSQEEVADLIKLGSGSSSGNRKFGSEWNQFPPIHTNSELESLYRTQSEPASAIQKVKDEANQEQSAFDPLKQHKLSKSFCRGSGSSIRRRERSSLSNDDGSVSPAVAATRREESQPAKSGLSPEIRPDPEPLHSDVKSGPAPHASSVEPSAGAVAVRTSTKTGSSEGSEPPTSHSIYDIFKVFKEFMKLRHNEAGQELLRLSERYQRHSQVLEDVFERAAAPDRQVDIPDHLCCKITMDIFRDPVMSTSGFTYERAAILDHIRKVGPFDPITRVPLTAAQIIPNFAIKAAVQAYLDEYGWAYGPC